MRVVEQARAVTHRQQYVPLTALLRSRQLESYSVQVNQAERFSRETICVPAQIEKH
jgi:hypothetical protein